MSESNRPAGKHSPSEPATADANREVTSRALLGGGGGSVNRHLVALFLVVTFVVGALVGRYAPWDDIGVMPRERPDVDSRLANAPDPGELLGSIFSDFEKLLHGDAGNDSDTGNAAAGNTDGDGDGDAVENRPPPPHADSPSFWADRPVLVDAIIDGLTLRVRHPDYDATREVRLFGLRDAVEPDAAETWEALPGSRVWLELGEPPTDARDRLVAFVYMVPRDWRDSDEPPTRQDLCLNAYLKAIGLAEYDR